MLAQFVVVIFGFWPLCAWEFVWSAQEKGDHVVVAENVAEEGRGD